VFGGEIGGSFPDEVGDVAVSGQALQGCVIHVGAEREPVVGVPAAVPGPVACRCRPTQARCPGCRCLQPR